MIFLVSIISGDYAPLYFLRIVAEGNAGLSGDHLDSEKSERDRARQGSAEGSGAARDDMSDKSRLVSSSK